MQPNPSIIMEGTVCDKVGSCANQISKALKRSPDSPHSLGWVADGRPLEVIDLGDAEMARWLPGRSPNPDCNLTVWVCSILKGHVSCLHVCHAQRNCIQHGRALENVLFNVLYLL